MVENSEVCVAELWNLNSDSVDCWQLTDSLLAGVGDDLLCLSMENIQRRWQLYSARISQIFNNDVRNACI